MLGKIKNKLVDLKASFIKEKDDMGGTKVFLIALILTILFIPFLFVNELLIKPVYRTIRMIIDAPRLGMKKAHMKYFYSEITANHGDGSEVNPNHAIIFSLLFIVRHNYSMGCANGSMLFRPNPMPAALKSLQNY